MFEDLSAFKPRLNFLRHENGKLSAFWMNYNMVDVALGFVEHPEKVTGKSNDTLLLCLRQAELRKIYTHR